MAMEGFFTFSQAPGLEPHNQMQSFLIPRTLVWRAAPLCRDAVGVFYTSNRLDYIQKAHLFLHKPSPLYTNPLYWLSNGWHILLNCLTLICCIRREMPSLIYSQTHAYMIDFPSITTYSCTAGGPIRQHILSTKHRYLLLQMPAWADCSVSATLAFTKVKTIQQLKVSITQHVPGSLVGVYQ